MQRRIFCDLALAAFSIVCLLSSKAHAGYIDHFAQNDDIGINKAPNIGTSHILVVPVIIDEDNLPDGDALIADAIDFYDSTDPTGLTFSNYFIDQSQGRYRPVTTLAPAVRFSSCPFSRVNGVCTIARGDVTALGPSIAAIKEILDRTDQVIDFENFDVNGPLKDVGDGVIDGLVFISNIDAVGIALPVYRLCEVPGAETLYCQLNEDNSIWKPIYDNIIVPVAAFSPARTSNAQALMVSLHEFGHTLGFADLYNETNNSITMRYALMADTPHHAPDKVYSLSAFSRYQIGWASVRQADGPGVYTLRNAAESGEVLKLGTGDEYFLVEFRSPYTHYDQLIENPGVAVWHVDENKLPDEGQFSFLTTIAHCTNCDVWRPLLMLEQADGDFDLQFSGTPNDADDLFQNTDAIHDLGQTDPLGPQTLSFNTNRYDGSQTSIEISKVEIDVVNQHATVTIAHPVLTTPCDALRCAPDASCQDGECVMPDVNEEVDPEPSVNDTPIYGPDDEDSESDPEANDGLEPGAEHQNPGEDIDRSIYGPRQQKPSPGNCGYQASDLGLYGIALFFLWRRRRSSRH